jgi:hypothetical protein
MLDFDPKTIAHITGFWLDSLRNALHLNGAYGLHRRKQ